MINFFKKQKPQFYIFIAIFILGLFLRAYNFPFRFSLGEEAIRDAVIGIEGARELQFPLTGSFSSLGPFTFGPWYAYQLIVFHLIFPYIYSPWVYLTIISVIYIPIMYKIGKIIGGELFALVLSFLVAISPAQIISATHLTSHNNTNIFAALSIWIFLLIFTKNKSRWWNLFLGLIIGIGMNLHFQMSGLLILPLLILIFKRKFVNFVFSAIGVVISFIPMIIFEMNNHWFTTNNLYFYLTQGKNAVYVPNRWLFYVRDFWPAFWSDAFGIPVWFGAMIIILFVILIAWAFLKRKLNKNLLLLICSFSVMFVMLRYYWGPRFFGYLNFLRPFVFLFTAYVIVNLKFRKLYLGLLLLPLFIFFSYPRVLNELKPDGYANLLRNKVAFLDQKFPNKNFSVLTCAKTYKGDYNSASYSLLFLLEEQRRLSDNGIKIAIEMDCGKPEGARKIDNIGSFDIYDFSRAQNSAILEEGWKPLTFNRIYDQYARWWFELQP